MKQRLSPPKNGQGRDLKTLSPSSSTCRNSASKAGNFILKYLAIRVISASLKSGPKVLQNSWHRQYNQSQKRLLGESAGLSYLDFLVVFSLDWLERYDVPSAFAGLADGNIQYPFLYSYVFSTIHVSYDLLSCQKRGSIAYY